MISTQTEQTWPTAMTSQTVQAIQDQQKLARHREDDPTGPRGRIEMTFGDLVDLINPIQHVPIVGDLYRKLTGDEIKDPIKIMGAGLFGGPLGLVSSVAQTIWRDLRSEGEVDNEGEGTALAAAGGGEDAQSALETSHSPFEMAHAANAIGHSVAQSPAVAAATTAPAATPAPGPLTGLAALAAFSRDMNGIGGEASSGLDVSAITGADMVPSDASSLMMAQLVASQPPLPDDKRQPRRTSGGVSAEAGAGSEAHQPRQQAPAAARPSAAASALAMATGAAAPGERATPTGDTLPPADFLKQMEAGLERYQAMLAARDGTTPMPGQTYGALM